MNTSRSIRPKSTFAPQPEKPRLFRRDFTLVVIGQIISLFGNAVLRFALPLHLLRETGSSALFGAVTACSFVPMVVFSLLGGVIADRVNKRNIMVLLDACTALLIAVFYLALGRVPLVPLMSAVLMLLYGIAGAYQPAVQASIPLLAGPRALLRGNAVINMVGTLSGLLGPVAGGVLFGAFGLRPILILSAVCFALSAVMEVFIRIPHTRRRKSAGLLAAAAGDLRESFRFISAEKPAFLSVILLLALFNLVLSAALVVGIPVLVVQSLGLSDADLGLTQGAMGLGGLAGGLLAGNAGERLRLRSGSALLSGCALAVLGMGLALLPGVPARAGFWVITAMSFLAMAAATVFTVALLTAVQQQTPERLLGKVTASVLAVSNCAQPVGQALYGLLFDALAGAPWLVLFLAAVLALAVALGSRSVFARMEAESGHAR